jgi:hypothetical protein
MMLPNYYYLTAIITPSAVTTIDPAIKVNA